MAVIKRIIDGIHIEYATSIRPQINEYGVYLNKIWKFKKITGSGKNFRMVLEREKANEKIALDREEFKQVKLIGHPTGDFCV